MQRNSNIRLPFNRKYNMSKTIIAIILIIITIIAFYFYFTNRLPEGMELKGKNVSVALISLITAIVSLICTILTFIMKLIELKSSQAE